MTQQIRVTGHLLRVLGLAFALAVVVGGVVGQGIFRSPGIVARNVDQPWLILALWGLGGVIVLIDACAMVELGAAIPRAGGPYVYARRAFGHATGAAVAAGDLLVWLMAIAFLAVVFGEYVHRLGIATNVPIPLLSLAMILACWALNATGTRISGASQTLFSALKGVMLIVLIVALLGYAGPRQEVAAIALPMPSPPVTGLLAVAGAMRAVVGTYAGWWAGSYFNEEVVRPDRNVARAMFGGIALVTLLYIATNAAMLHVLTPAAMATSELPAADAAARVFGPSGDTLMTGIAVLSVFALTNLALMLVSRIGFGLARDAMLPALVGRVSARGSPQIALALAAVIAATAAMSGTYETLLSIAAAVTVCMIGLTDLAAIVLRRMEPDMARPFRMPLFPVPAVIGLILNLLLGIAMIVDDPVHAGSGVLLVIGVGVVTWMATRRRPIHVRET